MSTIQPQQQPEQQSQPQPQQQQQPAVVYPNTVTNKPPNSHHSNGSFGTVFIVLAIIVVISAIACFLGRLCNRRAHNSKPKAPKQSSRAKEGGSEGGNGKNNHHNKIQPKERRGSEFGSGTNGFRQKEGDLEFGLDMRSKPNGYRSDSRGHSRTGNGFRSGSRGHGGDHGIINGGGGDMKVDMKHGHVDGGGLGGSAC